MTRYRRRIGYLSANIRNERIESMRGEVIGRSLDMTLLATTEPAILRPIHPPLSR